MSAKYFQVDVKADKQLFRLPRNIQAKIIQAFDGLKLKPLKGIKLHGELKDYYKLRIGDYRIIYRFDSEESLLEITRIEHRQGVYK